MGKYPERKTKGPAATRVNLKQVIHIAQFGSQKEKGATDADLFFVFGRFWFCRFGVYWLVALVFRLV